MGVLAWLFVVAAFVCGLIILIDAFKSAVWKGIVGLLCGLYLLFYGVTEFKHEKRGLILAGYIIGALGAGTLNVWSGGKLLLGG